MNTKEDRYEVRDLIDDAVEELEEAWKDGLKDEPYPEDRCHEIADGWCPLYTHETLKYAAADCSLATEEPECGPAFDGSPTPVNIIVANIYEKLSNALHQRLNELQESEEEES